MSWANVLRGVAYGDAWGAGHEFWPYDRITSAYGARGPEFPTNATITDDTQMTLALADALHATEGWHIAGVQDEISTQFLRWLDDPDNTADRAPGSTCLSSLEHLEQGDPWYAATSEQSKGCGTVMRTAASAFLPEDAWRPVTAFASAITHGHPTATVAALVTARIIREGKTLTPGLLIEAALDFACDASTYFGVAEVLSPYLDFHDTCWDEYFNLGRDEFISALTKAQAAKVHLVEAPWVRDICSGVGEGWIAEETVAVALLAADLFPNDPQEALRRAATTGGDSDSIAAVAGAFLGAVHDTPWPEGWLDCLEPRYREHITLASAYWEN